MADLTMSNSGSSATVTMQSPTESAERHTQEFESTLRQEREMAQKALKMLEMERAKATEEWDRQTEAIKRTLTLCNGALGQYEDVPGEAPERKAGY